MVGRPSAGEDYVRNLAIADLDFATIHVYPDSWGVPSSSISWMNDNWIGDRAALAAAAGKPLMFEVGTSQLPLTHHELASTATLSRAESFNV